MIKELPRWEIQSRKIRTLDRDRGRLNLLYGLLDYQASRVYGPIASGVTIGEVDKLLGSLERRVEDSNVSDLNGFDCAVFFDIAESVRRVRATMDYLYNPKGDGKIARFLGKVYGRGTFKNLLKMLEHSVKAQDLHFGSLRQYQEEHKKKDTEFEGMREKLKQQLPKYKEILDRMSLETGLLAKPVDYEVLLSPPYESSFWDDKHLIAAIDPTSLDQEHRVSAFVFDCLVHEFIGHGLNSYFSRNMPKNFCPPEEEYNLHIQGVLGEGVALFAERFGLGWMKRNRTIFFGGSKTLHNLQGLCDFFIKTRLLQVAYDILANHEWENQENERYRFDAIKRISEITRIPRFTRERHMFYDRSFSDTLGDLQYVMGIKQINGLVRAINKKINTRKNKNRTARMIMLLHGFWTSPKAKEMFMTGPLLEEMAKRGLVD